MRILLVDDEANARYGMARGLQQQGREILEAANGLEAMDIIRRAHPHLIFLDMHMPELDGLGVLDRLREESLEHGEIIVLTANDSVANAVECIRRGATDFLAKPFDLDHLRSIVRRTEERVQLQEKVESLSHLPAPASFGRLHGSSRGMQRLFQQIEKAGSSSLPVLLRGESGTGKELVARELHDRSPRSHQPFVAVNTASIADSLVESELFGHVRGAFTGADRPRDGVFRKAHKGTLFLDEIGDMPPNVQTRLLRVLQEGTIQPVGSEESIQVDVRVISATHQNLEQQIEDRVFREDLYYRLRGIELGLPPLRERPDDILLLAKEFLGEGYELSSETMLAMLEYRWPGNVRELKQRVQSARAMADGSILSPWDLGLKQATHEGSLSLFEAYLDLPLTEAKNQLCEDFERVAIATALEQESGNVSAAARRLGIHRQNLQVKIKQWNLG